MRASYATAIIFLALALAGCLTPDESRPIVPAVEPPLDVSADETAGVNASLVLAEGFDPWKPGESQRVLLDATVQAGQCFPAITVFELVFSQYFTGGCAIFPLPKGPVIPLGTKHVEIEVDVSAAVQQGEYISFLYTRNTTYYEFANQEPTTQKQHKWIIPVSPEDWDAPDANKSAVFSGLWTANAVLQGPVKAKFTVVRDPLWAPLPLIDRWASGEYKSPQDGVVTLLDAKFNMPDGLPATGIKPAPVPHFRGELAVVIFWDPIAGCPPQFQCWVGADVLSAGESFRNRVELGANHIIFTYESPGQVVADHQYSEQSVTKVLPFFYNCPPGCAAGGSTTQWAGEPRTNIRVVVEAWKEKVDVADLKVRLGVK